jgi:deoxyribonuclease-1-like protein
VKFRRFLIYILLLAILLTGGWALVNRDRINSPGDFFRLAADHLDQLRMRLGNSRVASWKGSRQNVLRIGSFNTRGLDETRLSIPLVETSLARIISQYDVVALQEVNMDDPWLLTRFLRKLGSAPEQYDFVAGVADTSSGSAISQVLVFNRATVELESERHYTVNDPDNLVQRKPLVGWFRAKNTEAELAFTFSVVSVQFNPLSTANELLQIGPVFRAVRGDSRGEDDVIMVGDFGAPASQLSQVETGAGLFPLIRNLASSTAGNAQPANIMLDTIATSEFSGDSGVLDFMKEGNLTLSEAELVSDQLPVWADFHIQENTRPGRVADNSPSHREF